MVETRSGESMQEVNVATVGVMFGLVVVASIDRLSLLFLTRNACTNIDRHLPIACLFKFVCMSVITRCRVS